MLTAEVRYSIKLCAVVSLYNAYVSILDSGSLTGGRCCTRSRICGEFNRHLDSSVNPLITE